MKPAEIHQRLITRFGSKITGVQLEALDPWVEAAPDSIVEVCRFLKEDEALKFETLNDLSAVDYFDADPKKAAKSGQDPHLEVVYHLYSYTHKHSLKVKIKVPRWKNGVAGELPEVPSVFPVWSIADWHEREAFDLMGIRFLEHPNLRRILCPEDWVGHPLRKDYEFPLEYHGIRGK